MKFRKLTTPPVKHLIKKITFTRTVGGKRVKKKHLYYLGKRLVNNAENRAKMRRVNRAITNWNKLKNSSATYTVFRNTEYGRRNLNSKEVRRFVAETNIVEFRDVLERGYKNNKVFDAFARNVKTELTDFNEIRKFTGRNLFNQTLTINYAGRTYQLPPATVKRLFEHYATHLKISASGIQNNILAAGVLDFKTMDDEMLRNVAGNTLTGDDLKRLEEVGRDQFIAEKNQVLNIINEKLTAIKKNDWESIKNSFIAFITRSGSYLLEKNRANLQIKIKP